MHTSLLVRNHVDQQNKQKDDAKEQYNQNDCLWRHRKRQRYFVKRCMSDFKARNMTWVLLVDVDEYIAFNGVEGDDPKAPLDVAPEGVPTLTDWREKKYSMTDEEGNPTIDGTAAENFLFLSFP